jgi:hypothetical protein
LRHYCKVSVLLYSALSDRQGSEEVQVPKSPFAWGPRVPITPNSAKLCSLCLFAWKAIAAIDSVAVIKPIIEPIIDFIVDQLLASLCRASMLTLQHL